MSYEMLRCERRAVPIATTVVSPGPDVLVVENVDPYWALVDVLAESATRIGTVAWGAGGQVEQSIVSLWETGVADPGQGWYWGDADPEGVQIASRAAAAVEQAGVGRLIPHPGLWRAYATLPGTDAGFVEWGAVPAGWLGELWDALVDARATSSRIAQERLTVDALRAAVGGSQ